MQKRSHSFPSWTWLLIGLIAPLAFQAFRQHREQTIADPAPVDAIKIMADYSDATLAADGRFLNKRVVVAIAADAIEELTPRLGTITQHWNGQALVCYFDGNASQDLKTIRSGSIVTATGTCYGLSDHTVRVMKCSVRNVQPPLAKH